jgi:hypothetical protein
MFVLGTNTWEVNIPKEFLIKSALKFAEGVKAQGIAELQNFWLAYDERLLWCSWKTDNLEGLKAAFAELNKRSGLKSKLSIFEKIPIE